MGTSELQDEIISVLRDGAEPMSTNEIAASVNATGDDVFDAMGDLQEQRIASLKVDPFNWGLTEWAEYNSCCVCGEEIEPGEHYRLTATRRGGPTTDDHSGSLHTECLDEVLQEYDLQ